MENLTILQDGKRLPVRVPIKKKQKEFSILSCAITASGKAELFKLLGGSSELEKEDLLKPLVNANGLEENAVEERYRTMFYYLAIDEVLRRENA